MSRCCDSPKRGSTRLNDKYGGHSTGASAFYLFHRPRRWNADARIWMGHERKRGKLADLNALLRGGHTDAFSLIVGATEILAQVKYVITLDTDTQLPRDAASAVRRHDGTSAEHAALR